MSCACTTCHIIIEDGFNNLEDASDEEEDQLDKAWGLEQNSRLGCQAYPVDEMRIPEWFKELPFDGDAMESTILDQKIDNLIGVLGWDVQSTETTNTFNKLFDF